MAMSLKRQIEELKQKGLLPRKHIVGPKSAGAPPSKASEEPPSSNEAPSEAFPSHKRARTDLGPPAAETKFGIRPKSTGAPSLEAPEQAPSWKEVDSAASAKDPQGKLCAYGVNCKRYNCWREHPDGRFIDADPNLSLCTFGVRCARADCIYRHPDGRDIDEDRFQRFAIYLDEFSEPRQRLPPLETACEVFVDPLPGKEGSPELNDFLNNFVNDDSEVIAVDVLGEQERGYVLFSSHAAALACVDSGAGVWSESERSLSEKNRMREGERGRCTRTKNRWLLLRRLHKELPSFMSTSGVFGLKLNHDNSYSLGNSDHVHFTGKGTKAQIRAFRPLVEEVIAKFYEDVVERDRPRRLRMWGFPDVWTAEKVLKYFEQYGTVKYLHRQEAGSLDVTYRVAKDAEFAFQDNDSLELGGDGNKVRCELLKDTTEDDRVKIDYSNFHGGDSTKQTTDLSTHSNRPRPSLAPRFQTNLLGPSSCQKLSAEKVKVKIQHCPPDLDSSQMLTLFTQFGKVQSTSLRTDIYGKCSGVASVEFCTTTEATAAVEALNGTVLHDREITVDIEAPKVESPPDHDRESTFGITATEIGPPPGDFSEPRDPGPPGDFSEPRQPGPPGDFSESRKPDPLVDAQQLEDIELLIEERNNARKKKDWSRADEIREQLEQVGVVLMDEKGPARGKQKATELTSWRFWQE